MRLPNLFYAWPIVWSSLVDGDEQLDLPKRQNNFVMCSSTLSCLKFSHYLNVPTADPVSHLLQLNASLHQTSKDQYKLLASYFKAIFWYIFVERNGTPRNLFKQYLIQTIFVVVILHKYVSILQKISIKMPYLSYSLIPKSDLVVAIWDWK